MIFVEPDKSHMVILGNTRPLKAKPGFYNASRK
jgi:hypothetical protein